MSVRVRKHLFTDRAGALAEIARSGFWPTTLVTPAGPELPPHWHDGDVHAYVIEGASYMLDAATGERLPTAPGDRIEITRGALHAEGETTTPMVYIVAAPEPRPLREYLAMRTDPPAA